MERILTPLNVARIAQEYSQRNILNAERKLAKAQTKIDNTKYACNNPIPTNELTRDPFKGRNDIPTTLDEVLDLLKNGPRFF